MNNTSINTSEGTPAPIFTPQTYSGMMAPVLVSHVDFSDHNADMSDWNNAIYTKQYKAPKVLLNNLDFENDAISVLGRAKFNAECSAVISHVSKKNFIERKFNFLMRTTASIVLSVISFFSPQKAFALCMGDPCYTCASPAPVCPCPAAYPSFVSYRRLPGSLPGFTHNICCSAADAGQCLSDPDTFDESACIAAPLAPCVPPPAATPAPTLPPPAGAPAPPPGPSTNPALDPGVQGAMPRYKTE